MQLDLIPDAPVQAAAKQTKQTTTEKNAPEILPPLESSEEKSPHAFRTISEAATLLDVPQHVLRFWESRFPQIKPLKRSGGRRYYRPEDMDILTTIKNLLYKQGYTIKGAKKAFGQKDVPLPPVAAAPVEAAPKRANNDKRLNQLSVLRQELMGLRDVLKPYI